MRRRRTSRSRACARSSMSVRAATSPGRKPPGFDAPAQGSRAARSRPVGLPALARDVRQPPYDARIARAGLGGGPRARGVADAGKRAQSPSAAPLPTHDGQRPRLPGRTQPPIPPHEVTENQRSTPTDTCRRPEPSSKVGAGLQHLPSSHEPRRTNPERVCNPVQTGPELERTRVMNGGKVTTSGLILAG